MPKGIPLPRSPKGQFQPGNSEGGRSTLYREEYNEQARKLCLLLGATDDDLGAFFGVSAETIVTWRHQFPEFAHAVFSGKESADAEVADRFHQRAKGYSHETVKIFMVDGEPVKVPYVEHYPPDTAAASLWLRNRQPRKWRDRQEQTGADGGPIVTEVVYRWADPAKE